MKQKIKALLLFSVFILALNATCHYSFADDDDHKKNSWYHKILDWDDDDDDNDQHRKRNRKRHRDDDHDGSYLKPVNNPTYEAECGECHFLYQPELLPSVSWTKILDQPDDHFGEEIELDPDSLKIISDYLKSNGAENSSAKRSVKIMRSLGNHVPMRITDTPYIREKHHELNPEILKRESIGSLSNCIACHTTAEKGIYEDDNVKIPR
ncbi:diheme cytochrome c [Thermodesulfobacteriota bacterium]